jgi:hypothetical protein
MKISVKSIRERFLCALNDIDGGGNRHFELAQVYEQMGLSALGLPPAMDSVIQDQLLPETYTNS